MMSGEPRMPSQRVLIIHPEGNSYNNPSLKCIIDLFKDKQICVDLRYRKGIAPIPDDQGIRLIPYGRLVAIAKSVCINWLASYVLVFIYVLIEKCLYYRKYDLIIGVDREGLVEASLLSKISKTPYVFVSFEIMFASETSKRFKTIEQIASKNVSLWIVQDDVRSSSLCSENLLHKDRSFILPLASEGQGTPSSLRLRDKLGIPVDKKVAIVIGSITPWAMTEDIIDSLSRWPDEWVLIVHDRYGRTAEILSDKILSAQDVIKSKMFISDFAAEMIDDMGFVLAGVSAGLAFYFPDYKCRYTGNNLRILGMASGKISTYLRYGVPIITNNIGLYAEQALKHQFGLVVNHPDSLPEALGRLDEDRHVACAQKFYSEMLDFNNYRKSLWGRMSNVIAYGHCNDSTID